MFTEMRRRVKRVVYTLQMLSAGTSCAAFRNRVQVRRGKKDTVQRPFPSALNI
jgi:hypothetical protein